MLGLGEDFKSTSTPMEMGKKHHIGDMPNQVNTVLRAIAQRQLGIAGWICQMTMPEALYAWAYLAQFASNPNFDIFKAIDASKPTLTIPEYWHMHNAVVRF